MYNNFMMGFGPTFCSLDKQTSKYFQLYTLPCFHPFATSHYWHNLPHPNFWHLSVQLSPCGQVFMVVRSLQLLRNMHKNLHLLHVIIYICLGSSQCLLHVLQWVKPTSGDIPKFGAPNLRYHFILTLVIWKCFHP